MRTLLVWSFAAVTALAFVTSGACLLPDYQSVATQPQGGASSSGASTTSGGAGGAGGTGGTGLVCPSSFHLRLGSDNGAVSTPVPGGYTRIANDGGAVTSAVIGTFRGELVWENGMTPLNVTDPGNNDAFVVGINDTGHGVWAKQVKSGSDKTMLSVVSTPDSIIVLGRADLTYQFDKTASEPLSGTFAGFVIKLDRGGNLQWLLEIHPVGGNLPNSVNPAAVAVDPESGDIFVVGEAMGPFVNVRKPEPIVDPSHQADLNGSPFYVHLDENGDVVNTKVWTGSTDAGGDAIVLGPAGTKYVLGHYSDTFPNAAISNPPPAAPYREAYIIELDANDDAQSAERYGSDTREDSLIRGALDDDGNMYVLLASYAAITPDHDIEMGRLQISAANLDVGLNAVVARLTPNGMGVWAKVVLFPSPYVNMDLTLRDESPVLAIGLRRGGTYVDGKVFTPGDEDGLLALLDANTGTPMGQLVFGGTDIQNVFLTSSPCGDAVTGFFKGMTMLAGRQYTLMDFNVLSAFYGHDAPLTFDPW